MTERKQKQEPIVVTVARIDDDIRLNKIVPTLTHKMGAGG